MPTPPRRRPAGPPTRRPKVAGLRKPAPRPEPDAPETDIPDTPDRSDADISDASGSTADAVAEDTPEPVESAPPAPKPGPTPPVPETDEADGDDETDEADPVVSDGLVSAAPGESGDEAHENSSAADDRPRRPSPTGKRRATSRAVPVDLAGAERSTGRATRQKKAEPPRAGLNAAIGMAVVALLCAGFALYAKGQGDRLTSGADRANVAFTEPAATAEVKTKIVSALERALSYDYKDLDRTATAVREVLAGKAVCEYDAMFGQLRDLAPSQKLVHTTIVREMGVNYLSADRAEALVFIDQTSTRVEANETTASGAQLGVSAERVDGTWKITAFDTFNQPLPNGQPLPQC